MKITTTLLGALALALSLILSGCGTSTVSSNGTVSSSVTGTASDTMDASFEQSHDVALQTLKDLGFTISYDKADCCKCKGEIKACGSCCEHLTVSLEKISPLVTKVSVHVGCMGDESVALHILNRISANLTPSAK